eukprot:2337865-Rhodomonas_salina.1
MPAGQPVVVGTVTRQASTVTVSLRARVTLARALGQCDSGSGSGCCQTCPGPARGHWQARPGGSRWYRSEAAAPGQAEAWWGQGTGRLSRFIGIRCGFSMFIGS